MTPRRYGLAIALLVGLSTMRVHADRLHLDNGDYIDVDSWREDGDQIIYQRFGGTVARPRVDVIRIERTGEGSTDKPSMGAVSGPPTRPTVPTAGTGSSSSVPAPVLAELRRLREVRLQIIKELSEKKIAHSRMATELMKGGSSPAAATKSADFVYANRIAELQKSYDDANRRTLDFESQARAQYGDIPREQ